MAALVAQIGPVVRVAQIAQAQIDHPQMVQVGQTNFHYVFGHFFVEREDRMEIALALLSSRPDMGHSRRNCRKGVEFGT